MEPIVELFRAYGAQVSAGAILGIFVLLIGRGLLVPKVILDGWVRVWQERLTDKTNEATRWREAYELERTRAQKLEGDNAKLLEFGETTVRLLQAIPKVPHEGGS